MHHIGFHVETDDEFFELAVEKSPHAEQYETSNNGTYLCWQENDDFGPELWMQVQDDELMGIDPYFRGKSEMSVRVESVVEYEHQSPLDARLYVWLGAELDNPDSGICPCAIDMLSFYTFGDLQFPFVETLSVAAFPQEIEIYASEDDYYKNNTRLSEVGGSENDDETPHLAAESLIPIGVFGEDENSTPEPYVMLSGKVIETKVMENSDTKNKYTWALVKTLGGTIDVIINEKDVTAPVVVDGIISGVFWFCADVRFDEEKAA